MSLASRATLPRRSNAGPTGGKLGGSPLSDMAPIVALGLTVAGDGGAGTRAGTGARLAAVRQRRGACGVPPGGGVALPRVETVMNQLMALPTWDDRSPGWVDDQLVLVTAVVHQIGTLRGEYDDARAWGDCALALGQNGSLLRRADLMLHLSEIHRVTGSTERSAELVHEAVGLLRLHELSPEDVDALAPVTCHAFFCLGALAYWEGRPDEARPLLSHAWSHGGDSIPHLWSLVNHALVLTDDGDHEAALAFEDVRDRDGGPARRRVGHHRRSATTAPARCATWAATTRRTTSSPGCSPRSSPTTSPTRCSPAARTSRASCSTWAATGTAPCWSAPRWPSARAPASRGWRSRRPPSRRPSRPAGSGSAASGSPAGPWCRARRPRGGRHGDATRRVAVLTGYFSS